jgi:aspartate/methionine/tyrosine aminotransferase
MLIPVPKFPVYSAALKVAHGSEIPYELEEESGWSLNVNLKINLK